MPGSICGYEGGISSGRCGKTTYDYKEVTFVTGKPVVLEGTMTIKKSQRNESNYHYSYSLRMQRRSDAYKTVVLKPFGKHGKRSDN